MFYTFQKHEKITSNVHRWFVSFFIFCNFIFSLMNSCQNWTSNLWFVNKTEPPKSSKYWTEPNLDQPNIPTMLSINCGFFQYANCNYLLLSLRRWSLWNSIVCKIQRFDVMNHSNYSNDTTECSISKDTILFFDVFCRSFKITWFLGKKFDARCKYFVNLYL